MRSCSSATPVRDACKLFDMHVDRFRIALGILRFLQRWQSIGHMQILELCSEAWCSASCSPLAPLVLRNELHRNSGLQDLLIMVMVIITTKLLL